MIFFKLFWAMIIFFAMLSRVVAADDTKLTAYFFNDSVNGFQFSDAYETHNMGLKLERSNEFYQIDLGLVTPDMFEFQNIYRTANRSFGELITLAYGRKAITNNKFELDLFTKVTSQGMFGISNLQSIIHQFANFQDDIDLLETVRMPSNTWFGFGSEIIYKSEKIPLGSKIGALSYFGTDRLSLRPYLKFERNTESYSQFGIIGVEYTAYDEIISAPPVNARVREFRPVGSIGLSRSFGPVKITISENISLPSISSDDRIYARLFMSASMPLDDLSDLFFKKD